MRIALVCIASLRMTAPDFVREGGSLQTAAPRKHSNTATRPTARRKLAGASWFHEKRTGCNVENDRGCHRSQTYFVLPCHVGQLELGAGIGGGGAGPAAARQPRPGRSRAAAQSQDHFRAPKRQRAPERRWSARRRRPTRQLQNGVKPGRSRPAGARQTGTIQDGRARGRHGETGRGPRPVRQ